MTTKTLTICVRSMSRNNISSTTFGRFATRILVTPGVALLCRRMWFTSFAQVPYCAKPTKPVDRLRSAPTCVRQSPVRLTCSARSPAVGCICARSRSARAFHLSSVRTLAAQVQQMLRLLLRMCEHLLGFWQAVSIRLDVVVWRNDYKLLDSIYAEMQVTRCHAACVPLHTKARHQWPRH